MVLPGSLRTAAPGAAARAGPAPRRGLPHARPPCPVCSGRGRRGPGGVWSHFRAGAASANLSAAGPGRGGPGAGQGEVPPLRSAPLGRAQSRAEQRGAAAAVEEEEEMVSASPPGSRRAWQEPAPRSIAPLPPALGPWRAPRSPGAGASRGLLAPLSLGAPGEAWLAEARSLVRVTFGRLALPSWHGGPSPRPRSPQGLFPPPFPCRGA